MQNENRCWHSCHSYKSFCRFWNSKRAARLRNKTIMKDIRLKMNYNYDYSININRSNFRYEARFIEYSNDILNRNVNNSNHNYMYNSQLQLQSQSRFVTSPSPTWRSRPHSYSNSNSIVKREEKLDKMNHTSWRRS